MSNLGTLSFKQKDDKGHFLYNFKISNYHAAKILEYIAQIPHKPAPFRDSKGDADKELDEILDPIFQEYLSAEEAINQWSDKRLETKLNYILDNASGGGNWKRIIHGILSELRKDK